MARLPIRTYPDPVLRVRCPEVESFDDELEQLAADMVETMHAAPGIGLAAPQVGVERRLAVVDPSVGEDPDALVVMVNPAVEPVGPTASEVEGCLSIPDITERVERPGGVELRAQSVQGEPFTLRAEGLLARAILHEVDHLDGVLFVDRLKGLRRDRIRRKLKKLAVQQEEAGQEVSA